METSTLSQIGTAPSVTPQYLLCVRGAKSKLYAVAGVSIGAQSCIAAAEDIFRNAGFDTRKMDTKWGDIVSSQKNFAGYAPAYKSISVNRPI